MKVYSKQATVDTSIIRNNIESIKNTIGSKVKFIAVIKGDAYGHGLRFMADELSKNQNIDMLAVASLEEAIAISCNDKEILILYSVFSGQLKSYLESLKNNSEESKSFDKFYFTVNSVQEFREIKEIAKKFSRKIKVHVRLDFHGSAKGLSREDFEKKFPDFVTDENVLVKGLYAHVYALYGSETGAAEKHLSEYAAVVESLPSSVRNKLTVHFLTSMGFEKFRNYRFDAVRIGAYLYGFPITPIKEKEAHLKSPMRISAKILKITEINRDSTFDYSRKIYSDVKKIAILSIGYWDIPVFFSKSECTVSVNGILTKTVGEACMDTCSVDVSNIENVKIGDDVFFIDDTPGNTLEDKLFQLNLDYVDCQKIYMGMERLPKIYK